MRKKKSFDIFWKDVTKKLSENQKIRNWTANKGYLGRGDFTAVYAIDHNKKEKERIEMNVPSAKNPIIPVKKHSFQNVYPYWNQYVNGNFSRRDLCDITRHSKYIISIMYQFEELMYE